MSQSKNFTYDINKSSYALCKTRYYIGVHYRAFLMGRHTRGAVALRTVAINF